VGDRERQISASIWDLQASKGQGGTLRDTRLRSDCGQNTGTQPRALELKARDGYEKTSSRLFGE
jgi:hypothetical protein